VLTYEFVEDENAPVDEFAVNGGGVNGWSGGGGWTGGSSGRIGVGRGGAASAMANAFSSGAITDGAHHHGLGPTCSHPSARSRANGAAQLHTSPPPGPPPLWSSRARKQPPPSQQVASRGSPRSQPQSSNGASWWGGMGGGGSWWSAVHSVSVRVDGDAGMYERVTDEEWEPVLYLAAEPGVAMLMDALPPHVRVDPALGTFASTSWTQELVPPVLVLVATALALQLAL